MEVRTKDPQKRDSGEIGCVCSRSRTGRARDSDCGGAEWAPSNHRRCAAAADQQAVRRRITAEAVSALGSLGIALNSSLGFSLEGFRFSDGTCSVSAAIMRGSAFGLRRTILHELLVARAEEVGVKFQWGARVSDFTATGARVNGELFAFDWVVGADGQNSAVRKWAKLSSPMPARKRFGFCRHFSISPWSNFVEVHWGKRCQLVVTPTRSDEVCISFFTCDPKLRIDGGLSQFPEIARRVESAVLMTPEQGTAVGLMNARRVAAGRVALVGDASCSVDGIAGHGLSLGLQEALHLGEALAREIFATMKRLTAESQDCRRG